MSSRSSPFKAGCRPPPGFQTYRRFVCLDQTRVTPITYPPKTRMVSRTKAVPHEWRRSLHCSKSVHSNWSNAKRAILSCPYREPCNRRAVNPTRPAPGKRVRPGASGAGALRGAGLKISVEPNNPGDMDVGAQRLLPSAWALALKRWADSSSMSSSCAFQASKPPSSSMTG